MISPASLPSPAGYSFGSHGPMTQLEDEHPDQSSPSLTATTSTSSSVSLSALANQLHQRNSIRLSLSNDTSALASSPIVSPTSSSGNTGSLNNGTTGTNASAATPSTTFQKSAPASLSVALCRSLVLKYIYLTYLFLVQLLTYPSAAFQKFIRQRRLFGGNGSGRIHHHSSLKGDSSSTHASAAGSGIEQLDTINNSSSIDGATIASTTAGAGEAVVIGAVAEKFLQQYTLDNHLSQYNNNNNNNNSCSDNNNRNNTNEQSNSGSSVLRRSSRFKSRSDLEEIAQASTPTRSSSSALTSSSSIRNSQGRSAAGYGTDSMAEDGSGDNSTTRGNNVRLRQRMGRPMSGLGAPGSQGHGGMGARKKTLVLDLDETLIHSTSRGSRSQGYMVEVLVDRHACLYYVYKRPHVDYFLKKVAEWYKLVIFTASMAEYADPVIDWLDQNKTLFDKRYFRQACFLRNGSYLKDLTVIDPDLSSVCLLDNSPISYSLNKENGIPIDSWIDDPNDEALLDLLPFLDALRFTEDVRSVLSLRTV
ncbi:CTD nuclear envelope phosphatase 1 [Entomortierella parvispora]|uniref:CTD nuclear envelope phosphatase 1 n=1 Tax=Entomortierella parvispora TaxID=205924 RepID=A0A9P3LRW5_9FUNG|nr:CTD nuclear envelope phosphatase 1 [Entomortierella parvispora]